MGKAAKPQSDPIAELAAVLFAWADIVALQGAVDLPDPVAGMQCL